MRKTSRSFVKVLAVALAVALVPAVASAQWTNAAGEPVTNPDSSEPLNPDVAYDPATGLLTVSTLGTNGAVDGSDVNAAGDDVGMISIIIPTVNGDYLMGTPVGAINFEHTYFNGKHQVFGTPVAFLGPGQFAPPGQYNLLQLQAGLGDADFGQAEMGVNFRPQAPGATIFGPVRIVPEPAAFAMIASALLAGLGLRRRMG